VNFETRSLGDLCNLTMGRTPPRGNSKLWDASRSTKNVWISIADMTKSSDAVLVDSREYLSEEGSKSFAKVKAGTLLMSFKLSIGKLAIAGTELQTNEAIIAMNELNEDLILRDYLYYFLYGFDWSHALHGRFKVKGNTLNKKILEELPVRFPSLDYQREIVEKLDIAFAEIDLLEENLELSDRKATELIQSLLSASFDQSAMKPESSAPLVGRAHAAVSIALKDFCKMYQPPTISTKEMNPNGDYVVYGANGPIGRYDRFNHEEPQLLVTCRGATCGAVNVSEPFSWINGNAMVIQPNLDLATLEYMKYAFLGGIDVSSSITGSAQPQITRTTLEVIKVPLPTLEKQRVIVSKLDNAFAEIEKIKNQIAIKQDFAVMLRRSLLSNSLSLNKEMMSV
jgi:restriction endonuclease S subunit